MRAKQTRRQELKVVLTLTAPAELQGDLLTQQGNGAAGHRKRAALLRDVLNSGAPDGVQDSEAQSMPGQQAGSSGCLRPSSRLGSDDDGGIQRRPSTSQ